MNYVAFWIVVTYLSIGGVCVLLDIRSMFNHNLKRLDDYKYAKETDEDHYNKRPRRVRSHEEQVRAAFGDSFHGLGFTFLLWPVFIAITIAGPAYDGIQWLLAGREIKKARELDEEKKTKELLARIEEEERKKFDGL